MDMILDSKICATGINYIHIAFSKDKWKDGSLLDETVMWLWNTLVLLEVPMYVWKDQK